MLYPFILTIFVSKTYCHVPKNNSDVYITYSGHAEADYDSKPILVSKPEITRSMPNFDSTTEYTMIKFTDKQTDDVIFIPKSNDFKEERNFSRAGDLNIKDIQNTKILNILGSKNIQFETEPPTNKDVLFISGKNNENVKKELGKQKPKDTARVKEIEARIILDCSKLDCNKTKKAVCGGKREHSTWKYRLFLNECFFRKVNCAFKYEENRYQLVSNDKCKNIGAHYPVKVNAYSPAPQQVLKNDKVINKTRRSFTSRRSSNMGIDGSFCSHPCPETCPDEYEPQCAVSITGQKKVFMNHCKLDFNSCSYRVVWHMRPLAVCVGGKKADMRQNRGFINWMQRVGIVEKKGKLVLS